MKKKSNVVNKFQIRWQLIRCQARKIKDVDLKIEFVKNFITDYPSIENKARVKNWMVMCALPYRDIECRLLFNEAKNYLETLTYSMEDEVNDFSLFDDTELEIVYKDLSKRKYNFQFDKAPSTHVKFMESLKEYLGKY
tara:strand:- start:332 stop:745 length:414 start_codon:yes stop_codon:yes gene_type:complete